MPLNLSTTRRFVRLMIKRRPSLRFSTAQGNLAGRRSFYRRAPVVSFRRIWLTGFHTEHTGVQIYNSTAYVGARTPSAHSQNLFRRRGTSGQVHGSTGGRVYASSLKVAEEGQYSGSETTTDDTLEITDLNLDDFSWSSRGQSTSATSKPRILRSYRYRKSKSVDEAALSLLRMKEDEGTSIRHIHTWPTKTTRSIEWTLLSANSSELDGFSRVPSDVRWASSLRSKLTPLL
ncbi:hypothetical protein PHLGIDRAFT_216782 [Phlebiopsis gigantea 11061_1 CR5-6]|uniref:Uncharacterized protein n=1 Tax=Phlebiopsis gigantea (strain 11061_1 CR5-6) TaxID=745531 RepID=A0A0C3NGN4_PHLG1|nr:hypothetical protein PHLGIDRAFT_216782 [Phlebiopsis gigantea 11061_1 CR5-6]